MSALLYHILGWNENFENNKSREIDNCRYVCMPNKQDGLGLMRILSEPDGGAIFGVWCLILQACSRHRVRDGWLTEDGTADGVPWQLDDMALRWRRPATEIVRSVDFICTPKVGWMERLELKCPPSAHEVPAGGTEVPAAGTARAPFSQRERKKEEREGTTAPPKAKALALMELLFLSTQPRAVREWEVLTKVEAEAVGSIEILAFLEWAVTTARERGKTVEYAKHCLPEASEWKREVRIARGFKKPKDAA